MLFNGLRHFEPGVLIPTMQRLGIGFGSHVNAYTSFDETVYMLDLPNVENGTVDLTFRVMRDYADGALLLEDEIDKERGIIMAEMTSRESIYFRYLRKLYEFLMPDHLASERFPIGTEEVIMNAPRERFVDFYERYYNPRRLTFVAVGDMDASELERLVVKTFSGMTEPDNPGPEPDLGTVPVGEGFRSAVFVDEETASDELSLHVVRPYEPVPDTVATRVARLPLDVANQILSNRFAILAQEEGAPIRSGGAGSSIDFNDLESGVISAAPVEGRWKDAVGLLEQEFRRALTYGFTASELQEVSANWLEYYEDQIKSASTRRSNSLASQMVSSINTNTVFTSPEEDLRIFKLGLEELSPETVHEAFKAFWGTDDLSLTLSTSETSTTVDNTTDAMTMLYTESKSVNVTPPVEREAVEFAYTDFGPAGTVVSDVLQEDLDIRQLVLSNNVRVNLKQTDFAQNSIELVARFGTGMLGQPKNETGLASFAATVMNLGGLGNHSSDELQRVFAGKSVGAYFSVDEDAFSVSGWTDPDDLELQLQLMVASMTDPGYRQEAVRQFRNSIPAFVNGQKYDIGGAVQRMESWLRGWDGRFAVPKEEELMAFEAADVRNWIQPQLDDSYLEVSIVGDFTSDDAIPLILKTFGALPTRADSVATLDDAAGNIYFPQTPVNRTFTYESTLDLAVTYVIWKIPPINPNNIGLFRRMNILSSILDNRMTDKIREELAATYSPSTSVEASEHFDYGVLKAASTVMPDEAERIGSYIVQIAKNLTENGATEDEFNRAREPYVVNIEDTLRSNGYWLDVVMGDSQSDPHRLEWARSRADDYDSITVDEVSELAARYLVPGNGARVRILPVPPEGGAAAAPAAEAPSADITSGLNFGRRLLRRLL